MSTRQETRIYIPTKIALQFYNRYPGAHLNNIFIQLMNEFLTYTDGREGTLQDHINAFHEQVNT